MNNKSFLDLDFFKETYKMISSDQRKFEYRLNHHPFDAPQKRILKGLLFLKKNKKEEAFEQLKCTPFTNSFLEAMRRNVLGMLQVNYGTFRFAVEHLEKSIELFESIDEDEFILYPVLNIAMAYGNQKSTTQMAKYIDLADQYASKDSYLQILKYNTLGLYLDLSGQLDKAKKLLNNKQIKENEFYEWFKPSFQLLEFNINFKKKDYDSCYEVLSLYKKSNGYVAKANYEYMKSLLDYLTKKSPLYVYAKDFKNFPELFHQLEVIKALSRGDLETATKFWTMLKMNNKDLYHDQFVFTGDDSLFSETLKQLNGVKVPEKIQKTILSSKDPYLKLQQIFESCGGVISKDKLIEILWNEEVTEAARNRLRKLISRHNAKHVQKIISRQDAYFLDKKAA